MKKHIKQIVSHPFISSSLIMIVGNNITNVINYLYHFIMGRLLGPASYGELVSLFSLIGLLAIIPASLGLAIVKYISSTDKEHTSYLINWLTKKIMVISLILLILSAATSGLIANFLNIKNQLFVLLIGVLYIFSLPSLFYRSALQGLLRFKGMTASSLVEGMIKLTVGVLLVLIGLSVGGALAALVIASAVSLLLSRYYIKDYLTSDEKVAASFKPLFLYSIPVVIQSLAVTSLYSSDLILVKHFFSAHDAGIYGALSNLGKVIYFAAGPILAVMFPMVSQRQAQGNDFRRLFLLSFSLTGILSLVVLLVYWFFPKLAITILYGFSYIEAVNLLLWFGIFMAIFTLSTLLLNFHLSLGKTRIVVFPVLAALTQIIGIWFYHPNLYTVIFISIAISSVMLVGLFIYSLVFAKIFSS